MLSPMSDSLLMSSKALKEYKISKKNKQKKKNTQNKQKNKKTKKQKKNSIYYFLFHIVVQLIYNVVLFSGLQKSDSVIYIYKMSQFFSIIGYNTILNIVPCAVQQVLVHCISKSYIQQCVYVNFKLLICPTLFHFSLQYP